MSIGDSQNASITRSVGFRNRRGVRRLPDRSLHTVLGNLESVRRDFGFDALEDRDVHVVVGVALIDIRSLSIEALPIECLRNRSIRPILLRTVIERQCNLGSGYRRRFDSIVHGWMDHRP
ncbi:hypothetical protein CP556_23375 [Natrinema sp. CBA1119]|nr:hypothetical protein CP556_23375 [Natrinema sp. CBA1119]